MCRNIKTLFNFEPPASEDEIRAACEQFVRKLSGVSKPSKRNAGAVELAVEAIAKNVTVLLDTLETGSQPRDRQVEAAKAKARAVKRFSGASAVVGASST